MNVVGDEDGRRWLIMGACLMRGERCEQGHLGGFRGD